MFSPPKLPEVENKLYNYIRSCVFAWAGSWLRSHGISQILGWNGLRLSPLVLAVYVVRLIRKKEKISENSSCCLKCYQEKKHCVDFSRIARILLNTLLSFIGTITNKICNEFVERFSMGWMGSNILVKNGHFYHDQTSRPRATKPTRVTRSTRATRRTRVWWLDQPGLLSQISDYINA